MYRRMKNPTKESFEEARKMFSEGSRFFERATKLTKNKDFSGSIEASQHSVEFFIKSLFVLIGKKPPHTHDPGQDLDALFKAFTDINPSAFSKAPMDPLGRLKYLSKIFSRLHVESMYGYNGTSASKIFGEEDANYYQNCAFEVMFICLLIAFTFGHYYQLLPEEERSRLEKHAGDFFKKKK
jgi:hypothetical protein